MKGFDGIEMHGAKIKKKLTRTLEDRLLRAIHICSKQKFAEVRKGK